jgi:hypothetical protein
MGRWESRKRCQIAVKRGGGERERDVEMEERERGKGRIWDYDERRTEDIR